MSYRSSVFYRSPGLHRSVQLFRQTYGEIAVPLEAVSGIVYEPERKRGRLRLRLREGCDPLLQATGGRLPDTADPYRLTVGIDRSGIDRSGIAEYVAEEIRQTGRLRRAPPARRRDRASGRPARRTPAPAAGVGGTAP